MLSIVIPVLDEAASLRELHRQIVQSLDAAGVPFEIVFVDDGSSDSSWLEIASLAKADSRVSGIRFRRNFGKSAALTAGTTATRGELILTMDADLQDDPAGIPAFLKKLDEGYDVVNGWKERRLDPWHKVYPSRVFNFLVSWLSGLQLHDHNCGIKLYRAEVWREVRVYGDFHRFIPVLAHAKGFRVAELPVHHRPRQFGYSKFGVGRFLRGFLDLLTVSFLTGFGQRPQHLLGGLGLISVGLGALGLSYLGSLWLLMNVFHAITPAPIGSRPLLMYSAVLLIVGVQVLSLGLLAALIVANRGRDEHDYSIAEDTSSNHLDSEIGR
jgi:glycosyltransferase involved in cell wall biosynthesis